MDFKMHIIHVTEEKKTQLKYETQSIERYIVLSDTLKFENKTCHGID